MSSMIKNTQKELIGNLRGINLLILIWNSLPIEFPLDIKIKRSLDQLHKRFDNIFAMIAELSQWQCSVGELNHTIDDILDDELNYYNEETLNLSLAACYNNVDRYRYTFNNKERFLMETQPLFIKLLYKLFDDICAINLTINGHSTNNSLDAHRILCLRLLDQIIRLIPKKIISPAPQGLLENMVSQKVDTTMLIYS